MPRLSIQTQEKRQVVDITDDVARAIKQFGPQDGLCQINVLHTTAAVTTADLDPETDQDYLAALDAMAPKLAYHHPHDPGHFPDHLLSTVIGTDLTIQIENGQPLLGTWQRIVLIEFNGPRDCELSLFIR